VTDERKQSFHSSDTISLFSTNEACSRQNSYQLKNLESPTCCIKAENDCSVTSQKSSEACRKLQSKLYLAVGAKVMLLWNVSLSLGLVNGSTGTVVDFLYTPGTKAPSLPYATIVDFPEYKGPPFFEGQGREHWVPLEPQKYEFTSHDGKSHFRVQYPLCLAWALTLWKAQGLTIHGKVKLVLDDKERTTGLTYVGTSRCTELLSMSTGKALPLERLTTTISTSKVLQARLLEDERLKRLWLSTREFYSLS